MDQPEDPGGSFALSVEDLQTIPVEAGALVDAAERALTALGVPSEATLTIALVDTSRIADLKRKAFGIHRPTDVLAFPIDDPNDPAPGPVMLGDLVLCPEVARGQARALGRTLEAELEALVVHGTLHLLGVNHDTVNGELAMATAERGILAGTVTAR